MGLFNNGGWAYHHRLGVDTTAPGVDSAAPDLASASGAAAAEGLGCFGDGSPPSVAATQLRMGILDHPWEFLPQMWGLKHKQYWDPIGFNQDLIKI